MGPVLAFALNTERHISPKPMRAPLGMLKVQRPKGVILTLTLKYQINGGSNKQGVGKNSEIE